MLIMVGCLRFQGQLEYGGEGKRQKREELALPQILHSHTY